MGGGSLKLWWNLVGASRNLTVDCCVDGCDPVFELVTHEEVVNELAQVVNSDKKGDGRVRLTLNGMVGSPHTLSTTMDNHFWGFSQAPPKVPLRKGAHEHWPLHRSSSLPNFRP